MMFCDLVNCLIERAQALADQQGERFYSAELMRLRSELELLQQPPIWPTREVRCFSSTTRAARRAARSCPRACSAG